MRPQNLRRPITIYVRWFNPLVPTLIKPFRRVLHNVFWAKESSGVALNTGSILQFYLFAQCFLEPGIEFVPYNEWLKLSQIEIEGKWSLDERIPTQSIIVPASFINGVWKIEDHEFDWLPHEGPGGVTQFENRFIAETPGALRIQKVESRLFGTRQGQHVSIRA